MFDDILIQYPRAFGLLILVIPFIWIRFKIRRSKTHSYPPLQFFALNPIRRFIGIIPPLLEVSIMALLVLALAGPYRESRREFISESGIDIAFALDVSATMQAADFTPTRMEAMKTLTTDFVRRSGSNRIAVYIFAGHTFTQTPLTTDFEVIRDLIDAISFEMIDHGKSGGTAIGDALVLAADGLIRNRISGRDQAIVLLTDGESNMGIDPLLAARHVAGNKIRLYIVGIGGNQRVTVYVNGKPFINALNQELTTALDDRQLRNIAANANGRYYRATSTDVLADIFEEISRLEKTPLEIEQSVSRSSFRPDIAGIILACFVLLICIDGIILRRPDR